MNIRYKITLWIAGAGLVTSLILSLIVFLEMREQPYELLDADLDNTAGIIRDVLFRKPGLPEAARKAALSEFDRRYWVKVHDADRKLVYCSKLSEITDLPLREDEDNDGYTVLTHILKTDLYSPKNNHEKTAFRVRVIRYNSPTGFQLIQVALPMEKLEEEISDLAAALCIGLIVSTALLLTISYGAAGKIVSPISMINQLSREIDERNLDRRIPIGKSRDEIYELSSSLNRMFDRLQYSFLQQKQFIADASHELKSPAAMLRLFFEEALQSGDLPDAFLQKLVHQNQVALRMERLIKSLMELSVLELNNMLDLEVFSLSDMIRLLLEDFSAIFCANKIRLETGIPENLKFQGDKDKIRRVLINILDNAVKYNAEEGRIRLDVKERSGGVTAALFNTGPGIPQDDLDKVFDQFYRVEKSRSVQYGGAGLGLAIVRQIVLCHGGTVVMESDSKSWACIRIMLPQLNAVSLKNCHERAFCLKKQH